MLRKRLERLEAAAPAAGAIVPELPEILAHLEHIAELPAGSLPRTTEDAAARGYESIAHACADSMGMSCAELKGWLHQ